MSATVILSSDHVDQWRREMHTLYLERERIEDRLSELDELIGMAEELAAKIRFPFGQAVAQPEAVKPDKVPDEPLPLTDAIKQILGRERKALTGPEIRAMLTKDPAQAARLKASPNYYYTAIMRLRERGEVVREGKKDKLANLRTEAPAAQLPFDATKPGEAAP